MSGSLLDDDGPIQGVWPATLQSREHQVRQFASALVLRGYDPASLCTLANSVEYAAFKTGLEFFLERSGGRASSYTTGFVAALLPIARYWVKVDGPTFARLKRLGGLLRFRVDGLTVKNRERLRPFDDPDTVLRFLELPLRLKEEADSGKLQPRSAALLAQIAVLAQLLMVAPIRRLNLVSLEIDRHLHRTSRGMHLVIPKLEVKTQSLWNSSCRRG